MGLATQRVVYSASGRHLRRPPLDPLHNLRAAVNRRLPGGRQLQPEQALTPSEAVRATP